MQFTGLKLRHWRNFTRADVELRERLFITGSNASGKSNLPDALRFLRDIARSAGGLQQAVVERGELTKLRSLAARLNPKAERLKIAVTSPGRDLREARVRRDAGGNLRQGPAYISMRAGFANRYWVLETAVPKCLSLSRMIQALTPMELDWNNRVS